MATRRSIALIVLGLLQTVFWFPYVLDPPWTLPSPLQVGRWTVWLSGTFDLGTAKDFVPAAAMVVAGVLVMTTGFRRSLTNRFVTAAIWGDTAAILGLIVMNVIATLAGVVHWASVDAWLLLTLFLWFGPPLAGIVLLWRRKQTITP
jgi:hypothetical protein